MRKDELPKDWLMQTLASAHKEVEGWPDWKKIAYRVIDDPARPSHQTTETSEESPGSLLTL